MYVNIAELRNKTQLKLISATKKTIDKMSSIIHITCYGLQCKEHPMLLPQDSAVT